MEGDNAHTVTGVGLSAESLRRIQHGGARGGKLLLSMRLGCPILCFHVCYFCSVNTALSAQTLWYWRHYPKAYF